MSADQKDQDDQNGPAVAPLLRVITPDATAEEVAAVVAVLANLGTAPAPVRQRSRWADPARAMRGPHSPGRGGWGASALPR